MIFVTAESFAKRSLPLLVQATVSGELKNTRKLNHRHKLYRALILIANRTECCKTSFALLDYSVSLCRFPLHAKYSA